MPNKILISVEENLSQPQWIDNVEEFVQKVLIEAGYDDEEISILFCSDKFIQNLNNEYRHIDAPTDVLSFENGQEYVDEDGIKWYAAGDIAISLETLPKNAQYFEVDEDEELKRLLVHGLLHLNGYDHGDEHVEKNKEPVCEMLKKQKQIMDCLKTQTIMGK